MFVNPAEGVEGVQDDGGEPGDEPDDARLRSRRRFLAELGGALGVTLAVDAGLDDVAASADAVSRALTPLPSGYVFRRLITKHHRELGDVRQLLPPVMLGGPYIVFLAKERSGRHAAYRARIGGGRDPQITAVHRMVGEGRRLRGGARVAKIAPGDLGGGSRWVTVLGAGRAGALVAVHEPGKGLRALVRRGDRAPGGGRFTGHFGDVDADRKGDVLLLAHVNDDGVVREGLFRFPTGTRAHGRRLLQAGRPVPGTSAIITSFGSLDRHGDTFVVQIFARRPGSRRQLSHEPSLILRGRLGRRNPDYRVLVAHPALRPRGRTFRGEALTAARAHSGGMAVTVGHVGQAQHLHLHGRGGPRRVGGTRRGGAQSLSPGVIGGDGLLFYQEISRRDTRILVRGGGRQREVLSRGDRIGAHRLEFPWFGWHPEQADEHGRLVFLADLTDGSRAIVLGTPV